MENTILGIDFNNVMFRSFFGNPKINSNGENVNAVNGIFFDLRRLINIYDPEYIVFCNDLGRDKTFRRKMFPGYKSTRKDLDPNLRDQFAYAEKLLKLLGYRFINNFEYEADDILGMISQYATENEMEMIIVSSDRDYYQLINDHVLIHNLRTRNTVDKEFIYDKYELEPKDLIELKGLAGDTSDNIPGVYGIGEKTGIELIKKYKTIEKIYENLDDVSPNLKMKLSMGKEYAKLSKLLGTIVTDYKLIGFELKDLFRDIPSQEDIGELNKSLTELGLFDSLIGCIRYTLLPTVENRRNSNTFNSQLHFNE